MQDCLRELPDLDWDCKLGKLHVSIFPYFSGSDTDNLCFTDNRARATLLWDSPSIDFVKAYLSVVRSEFDRKQAWYFQACLLRLKVGDDYGYWLSALFVVLDKWDS
jgi:hypothetical protein